MSMHQNLEQKSENHKSFRGCPWALAQIDVNMPNSFYKVYRIKIILVLSYHAFFYSTLRLYETEQSYCIFFCQTPNNPTLIIFVQALGVHSFSFLLGTKLRMEF